VLVFIRAMRRVFGEFSTITVTICGLIAGFRSTGMPVSDPFADSQVVPGFPSIIKDDKYAPVYTHAYKYLFTQPFRPAQPSFMDQHEDTQYGHVVVPLPPPQEVMTSG
jgi:hypothetical protein